MPFIKDNYEKILAYVESTYNLNEEQVLMLYQNMWLYSHDIVSLYSTKMCSFTEDEIGEMGVDACKTVWISKKDTLLCLWEQNKVADTRRCRTEKRPFYCPKCKQESLIEEEDL